MRCPNVNKLFHVLCLTSIIWVQTSSSYEDKIDKLSSQKTTESKDLIEDTVKKKQSVRLQDTPTFPQENEDSANISHFQNLDTVPLLTKLNLTKYVRSFQNKLKQQDRNKDEDASSSNNLNLTKYVRNFQNKIEKQNSKRDENLDVINLAQISKWTKRLWNANDSTGNIMNNKTSAELLAWIRINELNQSKNQGKWAAMCLSFLIFLIFGTVCYSGMWKKRNIQLSDYYWNDSTSEFHNRNGTVRPKFSIQDLLRAKAKYLPRLSRKKKTKNIPLDKKKYKSGISGKSHTAEEEMKILLEEESTDEDLGYFRD